MITDGLCDVMRACECGWRGRERDRTVSEGQVGARAPGRRCPSFLNTAANDDGEIEVFRDVAAAAAPAAHGIRRYSRRYSRHGSV